MLEVKDLHVNYGAVHALNGISLHVDDGEIVSLIGANGAGKTTTISMLLGVLLAAADRGSPARVPAPRKGWLGRC